MDKGVPVNTSGSINWISRTIYFNLVDIVLFAEEYNHRDEWLLHIATACSWAYIGVVQRVLASSDNNN